MKLILKERPLHLLKETPIRDRNDTSHNKALKAVYKTYCDDVIKRHKLPKTLGEYIGVAKEYL